MSKGPQKQKLVDVWAKALELAKIMKDHPAIVEKALLARGTEMIGIYIDPNFKDSFQNLKQLKIESYKMAIEDVAMGAVALKAATLGLVFKDNKVQTFIAPHGNNPQGTVIFSIAIKNVVAFKAWRTDDGAELPEEEANAMMYSLIAGVSKLI